MLKTTKNSKAVQHLQSIHIQDEYQTPWDIFNKASEDYDLIPMLDVCATCKNTKGWLFFTKQHNALEKDWNQDFFMNPPYSKVYDFMKKAYHESKKNNVNGLILVYAKTDTKWWHEFIENKAEVHFIKGRIKFLDPDGIKTKNSAPYPSCWIIYRRNRLKKKGV